MFEEFDTVKTIVYDPKDEKALVVAMSEIDTCLLIPPARKVRRLCITFEINSHPLSLGQGEDHAHPARSRQKGANSPKRRPPLQRRHTLRRA